MAHIQTTWMSLWIGLGGCTGGNGEQPPTDSGHAQTSTQVFVTLAGHVEDHEMVTQCPKWTETRAGLLEWAEAIAPYTQTFNLQIDYPFIATMPECELPEHRSETGGENVLEYLQNAYGWEFDPHQEGGYESPEASPDDYADVHHVLSQAVSAPTDTVGGFVWNSQAMLDRLEHGYASSRLHDAAWTPEILTMAVHEDHHLGDFELDDNTSGIWHPANATEEGFLTHDPSRRLPYIGTGLQHANWSGSPRCDFQHGIEYASAVLNMVDAGTLPAHRMYTVTLAFPASVMLDSSRHATGIEMLQAAEALADSGRAQIASYQSVLATWQAEFGSEPNVLRYEQIDPAEYTCDSN